MSAGQERRIIGHEPSLAELRFVVSFIGIHLQLLDSLALEDLPAAAVTTYRNQTLAIQQSLSDLESEDGGYYQLPARVDLLLDAHARINRFLTRTNIEPAPRDQRAGPRLPPPLPDWQEPSANAITYTVDEYLLFLEAAAEAIPRGAILSSEPPARMPPPLVRRLMGFLQELAYRAPGTCVTTTVFLLRDALLLCLGMRRLARCGWPLDPRALFVNRKYLSLLGARTGRADLYVTCFNAIFAAMEQAGPAFGDSYVATYRRVLEHELGSTFAVIADVLAQQLVPPELPAREAIIIDNGVHGTMPLLCMAAIPTITNLRMYTVVPWLRTFYGARIHSSCSIHMREHESLVCQERLFQCTSVACGRAILAENADEAVRREGYCEIRTFLDEVDRHFQLSLR